MDEARIARIQREATVLRAIKFNPQPVAAIIEATDLTKVEVIDTLKKLAFERVIIPCKVIYKGDYHTAWGLALPLPPDTKP